MMLYLLRIRSFWLAAPNVSASVPMWVTKARWDVTLNHVLCGPTHTRLVQVSRSVPTHTGNVTLWRCLQPQLCTCLAHTCTAQVGLQAASNGLVATWGPFRFIYPHLLYLPPSYHLLFPTCTVCFFFLWGATFLFTRRKLNYFSFVKENRLISIGSTGGFFELKFLYTTVHSIQKRILNNE